jgi:hypothetical protein
VLNTRPAAVSSTAHTLLQLSYAAQHTAIHPRQHPLPLDKLRAVWSDGGGKLQQYAVGCGGLDRILQDLDRLHPQPAAAVCVGAGALDCVLAQLRCLALISACSPEAVLRTMSKEGGINAMQLCARIFSWLQGWAGSNGSEEERGVCVACQAAALEVLLHLVVTADQQEGVQQDVRDELKMRCVVDPVPGVLKEAADGGHVGMAVDAGTVLEGLGMHYMIR